MDMISKALEDPAAVAVDIKTKDPILTYKNVFECPDHLPKDLFVEAIQICQVAKEKNKYNHHKGKDTRCHHDRVMGWNLRQCADCNNTDLGAARFAEEERQKMIAEDEDAQAALSHPHVDRLHGMGIRLDFLMYFSFAFNCWKMPTWQVVRDIIVPLTIATRCRFADLPWFVGSDYFGPADVFMSHCWGSTFGDLVAAACHGARSDRYVWIDIFAVRQWPGNGADLDFRGVIAQCKAFILSISTVEGLTKYFVGGSHERIAKWLATPAGVAAKKALPTFRLWCIVEIAAAIFRHLAVVVKGGCVRGKDGGNIFVYDLEGADMMMQKLMYMINVAACECAVQADYDREMKVVREMQGGNGVQHVNDTVAGVIVGAAASIQFNVLEIDSYMCGEPESLRALTINVGATEKEKFLAITVLDAACSSGRLDIVKELLQQWIGVEQTEQEDEEATEQNGISLSSVSSSSTSSSSSPFIVVNQNSYNLTQEEKVRWVQELIDESIVVWNASSGGHANVVDLLLNVNNVNVNVTIDNGATALCQASSCGHLNVVKTLMKRPAIDVNKPDKHGITPLFMASQMNRVEIVQTLLTSDDIDVNKTEQNGCTSLYSASQEGHFEIVQILLAREDIDVNIPRTDVQSTPLYIASDRGHVKIVQTLLAKDDTDANRPTTHGYTPLYVASSNGHVEIVQTLLTRDDTDVNKPKSDDGSTPLYIASGTGRIEIVKALLAHPSIDVNKAEQDGCTSLWLASQNGNVEIVQTLLGRDDIDVNVPHTCGITPLFIASQMNRVEVVRTLLAKEDIDVNKYNNQDATPLFIACIYGYVEIVRLLLSQPNINIKTNPNDGCTALGIATEQNHNEVVQLLIEAGAVMF